MNETISDIHSYALFANIDNRDGTITGHRVILTDAQIEAIEDIVTAEKITISGKVYYDLEDGSEDNS